MTQLTVNCFLQVNDNEPPTYQEATAGKNYSLCGLTISLSYK